MVKFQFQISNGCAVKLAQPLFARSVNKRKTSLKLIKLGEFCAPDYVPAICLAKFWPATEKSPIEISNSKKCEVSTTIFETATTP